jgi:uncharacterized protein
MQLNPARGAVMLRIQSLKIPAASPEALEPAILKVLGIPKESLISYSIYKRSVDARRKDRILLVYTIDAEVTGEQAILKRARKGSVIRKPEEPVMKIIKGTLPISCRPVIIGTGPAGLFAGLLLSEQGYRPILLEKGKRVPERIRDVYRFWNEGILNEDSNVQFGEGGAGTFSDGKLTTRINDPRCRWVLEALAANGAPEEILFDSRPHIGTDRLRQVVVNLRKKIESLGGQVRFEHEVAELVINQRKVSGIRLKNGDTITTDVVIAAMGHSARNLFARLHEQGVNMTAKAFSIGVRIEHPQQLINQIQYGAAFTMPQLGAADYRLSWHHPEGRGAYSFCMCPGGQVVASASEPGGVVTNGMSAHGRNGRNANSALLVSVTPDDFGSDHPLAGIDYQRKWEKLAYEAAGCTYQAPAQRVEDFLQARASHRIGSVTPTYRPGVVLTDLQICLPSHISDVLRCALGEWNRTLKGFAMPDALLTGVETRSSSPVRILRDSHHESSLAGFYPAGEGSGHAGGIMSAAVDGLKTAEAVMKKFGPCC